LPATARRSCVNFAWVFESAAMRCTNSTNSESFRGSLASRRRRVRPVSSTYHLRDRLVHRNHGIGGFNLMLFTSAPILEVASRAFSARRCTSFATTANPRPASPADAACIEAFRARMWVRSAMLLIRFTNARDFLRTFAEPLDALFCLANGLADRSDALDRTKHGAFGRLVVAIALRPASLQRFANCTISSIALEANSSWLAALSTRARSSLPPHDRVRRPSPVGR